MFASCGRAPRGRLARFDHHLPLFLSSMRKADPFLNWVDTLLTGGFLLILSRQLAGGLRAHRATLSYER